MKWDKITFGKDRPEWARQDKIHAQVPVFQGQKIIFNSSGLLSNFSVPSVSLGHTERNARAAIREACCNASACKPGTGTRA